MAARKKRTLAAKRTPARRATAKGAARAPAAAAKPERKAVAKKTPAAGAAKAARQPAKARPSRKAAAAGRPAAPPLPTEPDPESYFLARVRGEEAVREAPHPMTEAAVEAARGAPRAVPPGPAGREEQLGELPWAYGDDALVALPRDPRTLFLYWDHAEGTRRRTWEGLEAGRPQIWIYAKRPGGEWERVRVVEFALESRSYYVHELEPGLLYRAEIHVVDPKEERLLPHPSNEIRLPSSGPAPVVDDLFARIEWGEPLSRWLRAWRAGGPFPEELRALLMRLSDWSRFAGATWGGSAGGMGGRPFSPSGGPGSPSSPPGG